MVLESDGCRLSTGSAAARRVVFAAHTMAADLADHMMVVVFAGHRMAADLAGHKMVAVLAGHKGSDH
jgi:hypothetical protein